MAKTKISEFSTTPGNNTDINGINIAEGCAPSGINNAIRELMSDLKEWQSGAMDVYVVPQGTAAAPGIQLYGDLDTGLYGYAANQLGVAVGGASAGYFSSDGWVGNVVATTVDLTNIEVTNIKAKDGTAAITIADSTGIVSVSTQLAVDNLNLSVNTISSSDTNGNIILAPNGTGDVYLDADTIRVGDSNTNVTITSNGTADLILNTNSGTNSGSITIQDGVNGNILIATNGTGQIQFTGNVDINGGAIDGTVIGGSSTAAGSFTTVTATQLNVDNIRIDGNVISSTDTNGNITLFPNGLGGVYLDSDTIRVGEGNAFVTISSNGGSDLVLNTNNGTNSGYISIADGVNGNIVIATNGTGQVQVNADLDVTTIETTNIKAKDGTAALSIADSTGVVSVATALTANGGAVFNENGADVDFRVESDTDTHALFVDASANNVGIGTNNPAYKLDVNGNANIGSTSSVDTALFVKSSTVTGLVGAQSNYSAWSSGGLTTAMNIGTTTNNGISFGTNNIGRLNLDSSGNLGLGVTPSASWSSMRAFQNGTATFANDTGAPRGRLITNAVYNGSNYLFLDASSNYALNYTQDGATGAHQWRTSTAAGTSPNTATLSTLMTLDASGNLVVGATSTSYRMEVVGPSGDNIISVFRSGDATAANNAGGGFRSISSATAASRVAQVWLDADGANLSGGDYFYIQKNGNSGTVDIVQYSNAAMTFATDATERARITSGGNLDLQNNIGLGGASATTSGTGITFPATQSASSDANTLDDYEEGYFTPTLTCGTSGSITLDAAENTLAYTKIGRVVYISGQFAISSVSSPVGTVTLNNLPFAVASLDERAESSIFNFFINNTTTNTPTFVGMISTSGGTTLLIRAKDNTGAYNGSPASLFAASDCFINGFYLTD